MVFPDATGKWQHYYKSLINGDNIIRCSGFTSDGTKEEQQKKVLKMAYEHPKCVAVTYNEQRKLWWFHDDKRNFINEGEKKGAGSRSWKHCEVWMLVHNK